MIEVYYMARLAQRPLRAMARRWVCRGLSRVTRGEVRCPECRQP
jgi:hypothetical protein